MTASNLPKYDLLRLARDFIGGIPDHQIDLAHLITVNGDADGNGTLACAAGWLTKHTTFIALGLGFRSFGFSVSTLTLDGLVDRRYPYASVIAHLFALPLGVAERLFSAGEDDDIDSSGKAIWLHRIDTLLAAAEQA